MSSTLKGAIIGLAGLRRITGKPGCRYLTWKSLPRQIYAWIGRKDSPTEPILADQMLDCEQLDFVDIATHAASHLTSGVACLPTKNSDHLPEANCPGLGRAAIESRECCAMRQACA